MTPEEINMTIVEHCGWTMIRPNHNNGPLWGKNPDGRLFAIPNYHGDLNATHEAVRVLTDEQREAFGVHLRRIWMRDYNARCGYFPRHDDSCNATAPQRAEAFLRTVGKWKDYE